MMFSFLFSFFSLFSFLLHTPNEVFLPENLLKKQAEEVLFAFSTEDFEYLSSVVHPLKGVYFSPYAFLDTTTAQHFSSSNFLLLPDDVQKKIWGYYAGSGEEIRLSYTEYIQKFVYDKDFINAPYISYNTVLAKGNSINNILELFPKSVFVEFYFPGFDVQYEGMDWECVRLVFEQYQEKWYLVAIVHDQWTP